MPNPKKLRARCLNDCGQRITKWSSKYCSNRCQAAAYRNAVLTLWRQGKLEPTNQFNSVVRTYLIQQRGERCERCGWNERNAVTGRVPIEIEHIDGDWTNNDADNIALLCPIAIRSRQPFAR